ncbi:MAG: hybrid sensor histidine kinase/response regulator [Bacteroidia bacterium]
MYSVLCVDDEPTVVEALRLQLLSLEGDLWIEIATDGYQALQKTTSLPYPLAVAIIDQLMPGMKGDQLIAHLAQKDPYTQMILLTGQAQAEDIGRIVNTARLFRFIAKPWQAEDLRMAVREGIRLYALNLELEEKNTLLKNLVENFTALLALRTRHQLENQLTWQIPSLFPVEWQKEGIPFYVPALSYERFFVWKAPAPRYEPFWRIYEKFVQLLAEHILLLEELESRVQERTAQLAQANAQLTALVSQKEAFVKIVSHDLRSPLSGLQQLSRLLSEPTTAQDPHKVKNYAQLLQNALNQLLQYVQDLLHLSRLQQNEIHLDIQPVQTTTFCQSLKALIEPQARAKNLNLQWDCESFTFSSDAKQLRQALLNLLTNAIKFTPPQGKIHFTLRQNTSATLVEIQDTGIGIPEAVLPHLFDPGKTRSRMGTQGEKGTGLGLAITKAILDRLGATIHITSQENQGTQIQISLPK